MVQLIFLKIYSRRFSTFLGMVKILKKILKPTNNELLMRGRRSISVAAVIHAGISDELITFSQLTFL